MATGLPELKHTLWEQEYRTRKCSYCHHRFADKEKFYFSHQLTGVIFCEECKEKVENLPDFDPEGSREEGCKYVGIAKGLALWRDDYNCRVCGSHDGVVQVHHIIPLKDGGTNSLKNLVTLCKKHHLETFKNGYAGLRITERFIQQGVQKVLLGKL